MCLAFLFCVSLFVLFCVSSFDHDRPMRPALRERLRTHKVFTKRTAFHLNYPKLSY